MVTWTRDATGEYHADVTSGRARLIPRPGGNWRIMIDGSLAGTRKTLDRAQQLAENRKSSDE